MYNTLNDRKHSINHQNVHHSITNCNEQELVEYARSRGPAYDNFQAATEIKRRGEHSRKMTNELLIRAERMGYISRFIKW